MIRSENLDIRAVTMGISLPTAPPASRAARPSASTPRSCAAPGTGEVAAELQAKYGIPIVNRRISVTPIADVVGSDDPDAYVESRRRSTRPPSEVGIDFIGGFTALVQKGFTRGDTALIDSIPEALGSTERVCASVNVATTRAGINMDAVLRMADVLLAVSKRTADHDGIGCAKLVVFCNAAEDNPFMAGAFHGSGEPECGINVGVSGPGRGAQRRAPPTRTPRSSSSPTSSSAPPSRSPAWASSSPARPRRCSAPSSASSTCRWRPRPAVGDSVAEILESMGLEPVGAPGTTAALAMLNDAVKKGGTMATSSTGGLSGAFIPVSEDKAMARAAADGTLPLEKLEAMTCVCSLGLDMIAVPGDISRDALAGIIADDGDRHDQLQDHRRPPHPGRRQEARRLGDARRAVRRGPGDEGQHRRQQRVRAQGRAHSRRRSRVSDELAARAQQRCVAPLRSPGSRDLLHHRADALADSVMPSARETFSASVSCSTASIV